MRILTIRDVGDRRAACKHVGPEGCAQDWPDSGGDQSETMAIRIRQYRTVPPVTENRVLFSSSNIDLQATAVLEQPDASTVPCLLFH